ncbi:hypothetical protein LELG_03805 [Lodderomyces elongisporus NRRL YB-4239]|uniref:SET domain-containing protein n=1 Tax=Lodderomyces elongisporus (strain ATCC 11503 / CBS 2605 / JCM 1781 / NBRC 1676 / NRRL YB-4239) TaxID=379508 RepID=A5E2G8_LODEL|nr:hypothetical protein LELG_03805 [Lodderomyces elongisporus NRRL YB-4239]
MSLTNDAREGFHDETVNYLEWLKQNNYDISDKVAIHDYTSVKQGRGVIALANIDKDEIIATIPKLALLNVIQNSLVAKYPELKYGLLHLNHWEALIIILLYELQNREQSKWKSYLNVLPTSNFDQLMFWSSNELNQLQPSCILERVGKDQADKMFDRIMKIIHKLGITDLEGVTLEQYNVVATLIMSYSFDVEITEQEEEKLEEFAAKERRNQPRTAVDEDKEEKENESEFEESTGEKETTENGDDNAEVSANANASAAEQQEQQEEIIDRDIEDLKDIEERQEIAIIIDGYLKSMVPFADTLNADTNYNNAIVTDANENLVIKAIEPIQKGEQIYNTYSEHPNSEILRRYGYVELQGSKHDFGEIPLSIIKQFFLEKYNVEEDDLESLLRLIAEISLQEQSDEQSEDGVFEVVIDSYDCFRSGEVIVELIFLIQLLTTFLMLNETVDFYSVRRIYLKCYQLIESKKVTKDFMTNFDAIFEVRMDQYPNYAAEPFNRDISNLSRELMAEVVLKSEYQSLKACKEDATTTLEKTLGEKIKIIADDKFLRALQKKRPATDAEEEKNKKKQVRKR